MVRIKFWNFCFTWTYFHRQGSYDHVQNAILKLKYHIFHKENFGFRGVNKCWLNSTFHRIFTFFLAIFLMLWLLVDLVNSCWLNFLYIFFIANYIVSAFKCRVACPLTMFCYGETIQNIKLILKQNYEFSMKIQMLKNVHFWNFANFGQHLLPICWWYGQIGFGGL